MPFKLGGARYPGAAVGVLPGTTITEVSSFFLFADSFNRADNPVVGNGWVEEAGVNEILTNALRQSGGAACFAHRPNVEATSPNLWVQAIGQWSNSSTPIVVSLCNTDAFGVRDGYQFREDDFGADLKIERVTNGALVLVGNFAVAALINTDYVHQCAVSSAPNLQEFNWWRQAAPGSIRTVTSADAVEAAANKRGALQRGGIAATGDWDSCLICRGAADPFHITCSGMRVASGDKIRVFSDLLGTVLVAEATEVAGVATIDLFAPVNGLEWPLTGHPRIDLTDAANVSLSNIQGGGFLDGGSFPGGIFAAV